VTLQYATAKAGAILVNVNPAYRTSELAYALGQSGVSTLVLAPRFRQADYLDMLDQVAGDLPALQRRVVLGPRHPGRGDGLGRAPRAGRAGAVERLREREALLQFDDPINIQYTSGTTGFPKGATLSHHNILNNGFFIGEGCGYSEADRVCIPVPLYHCFGMVLGNLACTTHGAAMVYPAEAFEPRGDPRPPSRASAVPPFMESPQCSLPSSSTPASATSTYSACAPGSWPAHPARSR
jgi:fatty-acyl-CoA synthase